MTSLPPYPRTKPINIPWIGEVPEHWLVSRFKYWYDTGMGATILGEDLEDEGTIPVFSATESSKVFGYVNQATVPLSTGDLVIPARGNSIGSVMMVEEILATSTQTTIYAQLKDVRHVHGKYAFYFQSGLRKYLFGFDNTAIPQLTVDQVRNNTFLLPPLPEQTHIARYLDHKTALIDAFLARKWRMIALLKERRQALISHAVTKGLDPSAPMKDSGIEWIGVVPAHWEVSKVKHLCKVFGRIGFRGYAKEDLVQAGEGALVIGGKHIGDDELKLTDPDYLSWEKYYESPEIMIAKGDIVVSQRGTLGKVAVIDRELGPATINPSMILLKELECDSAFFGYFFKSAYFKSFIDLVNTSTAVPMISQEQLGNVTVSLPPRDEQLLLVEVLNERTTLIDDEIIRIQTSMERVREYRQALISAVVTGKVDVRGVEVPEADQMISGSDDQMMEYEEGTEELSVAAEPED